MTFLSRRHVLSALPVTLAACGIYGPEGPPRGTADEVAQLERAIRALGPRIDPAEARRAAVIAYDESHTLALRYDVRDVAVVHNMKVNAGLRTRGLCYQWADDMEARMRRERFRSIALHRAIANADNLRLEHSTLIISQVGDTQDAGIVIDPWREAGRLTWKPVAEDTRYVWIPKARVMAWHARQKQGYDEPLVP